MVEIPEVLLKNNTIVVVNQRLAVSWSKGWSVE
jgi:hypothetical protein